MDILKKSDIALNTIKKDALQTITNKFGDYVSAGLLILNSCCSEEILSLIEEFKNKDYEYIIAIGNNLIRRKLTKKYSKLNYYTAIHPTAVIGNMITIEEGTVVMANVVINPYSKIGKHCILNTSCVIEDDNTIDNYVHISPNATLCGNVFINKYSWIGAVVIQNKNIGKKVIVEAGTIVIRNVENGWTLVGNPGKVIRQQN